MKRAFTLWATLCMLAWPAYPQTASKLRVLAAPGVKQTKSKDWHNSLAVSSGNLLLHCRKCSPIHDVTIPGAEIATLRYGQNAYHHWVAGIMTGAFSLGAGLIIGLMPHHEHFYSISTDDGKVLGIQADKRNYRKIAGMLENLTGLPIRVSVKDAHFLNGFKTKTEAVAKKR